VKARPAARSEGREGKEGRGGLRVSAASRSITNECKSISWTPQQPSGLMV